MIGPKTEKQIYAEFCMPFDTLDISWRIGQTNEKYRKPDEPLTGRALAYIDARVVMERLDNTVGFMNWQNTYSTGVGTSIVCNLGVLLAGDWIWKADGAGPSDIEADKGALSDAFKRSAVRWGIGRYLYEMKSPLCNLEKRGNSSVIPKETYAKLNAVHDDFAKSFSQQLKVRYG